MDLLEILEKLISFKSITPCDKDIILFVEEYLKNHGFATFLIDSKNCTNLYAEKGTGINICFAGHLDVVEPGQGWSSDPFKLEIRDNNIMPNHRLNQTNDFGSRDAQHANRYVSTAESCENRLDHLKMGFGRGIVDMKGAIAASMSIIDRVDFSKNKMSFMLACDEEHADNYGTLAILDFMQKNNLKADYVIVGEPTNPNKMGEMIKIGRRGSISFDVNITGVQGHVAYPENAVNAAKMAADITSRLYDIKFDKDFGHSMISNLEVTSIDVGNKSKNIIPGSATVKFNIRYSDKYSADELVDMVKDSINKFDADISWNNSAQPFLSKDQKLIDMMISAIYKASGKNPVLSTTGGTSDARFIYKYFPVIEYGLINATAHHVDECVGVKDLEELAESYINLFDC